MVKINISKVKLLIKVNGHIRSIILMDVLHVLELKGNLIFITKL
jgi:hypothetical protein